MHLQPVIALALLVAAPGAGMAGTVNWPQPGMNAAHTGYNKKEAKISADNIDSLSQKWAVSIPGGIQGEAPIEMQGIAFAQGADGTVYAVKAKTGTLLWTYPGLSLGITAGGDFVYATCKVDNAGHNGVCALNPATGALAWSFTISNVSGQVPTSSNPDNVPVYDRGKIFFGENYGGFNSPVSGDNVVALNATTGASVWQTAYASKAGGLPFATDNGTIFLQNSIADGGTFVCAISESHGAGMRCSVDLSANSSASVSVSDGKVLTQYNDSGLQNTYFAALDETSLAVVWATSVTGFTSNYALFPPAVANGLAYFRGGQNGNGSLYALGLKTGKQRWVFDCTNSTMGCPKSGVSVANGVLFTSCMTPNLGDQCAFDATSGALLRVYGSTDGHAGVNSTPLVANGAEIGACGPYGGSLCKFAP